VQTLPTGGGGDDEGPGGGEGPDPWFPQAQPLQSYPCASMVAHVTPSGCAAALSAAMKSSQFLAP